MRTHRGRFGLFAALPLPDVTGSISETIHAFDELDADGVTIETNHAGLCLGDSALDPLMQVLERRRAVVFVHPTSASCAGCVALAFDQPRPVIEFVFETTRAVANMLCRRTAQRFPNIRFIIPHAGGALTVLAARIADQATNLRVDPPLTRDDIFGVLRGLHYDLAGSPIPVPARALLEIAEPARLHYGSNWPFTPTEVVARLAEEIDVADVFDNSLRRRVLVDNALDLFPRLKR